MQTHLLIFPSNFSFSISNKNSLLKQMKFFGKRSLMAGFERHFEHSLQYHKYRI